VWTTTQDNERQRRRFARLRARCRAPGQRDRAARAQLLEFASECGALHPALSEGALGVLSEDSKSGVRTAAARGLRRLLEQLGGLARTQLVAEWTCSDRRHIRATVARALCNRIPILAASAALDQLSHDPDFHVRKSACEAATCRLKDDPGALANILDECARDAAPSVRDAANRGLARVDRLQAAKLRCVACSSHDTVVAQDAIGDWGFCRECLEVAQTPLAVEELGGEA
jgi:hypothetical protein